MKKVRLPVRNIPGSNDTEFDFFKGNETLQAGHPVMNDYYTLLIVLSGSAEMTVGYHNFTVSASHVAIVSPHVIYMADEITDDLEALQIVFTKGFLYKTHVRENIIDELLHLNPDFPPLYPLEQEAFRCMQAKFNAIAKEKKKGGPFHLNIIRLVLMELLYYYNRACEKCLLRFKKNMNRQYQLTYQFKQLVETEFAQQRGISSYADSLGVTSKHLSETVKEETGKTALEIIHERMLLEIQYLLKHSELSVKEIGYNLQFDSPSHFSRFFKSKTGITPGQYRENP